MNDAVASAQSPRTQKDPLAACLDCFMLPQVNQRITPMNYTSKSMVSEYVSIQAWRTF